MIADKTPWFSTAPYWWFLGSQWGWHLALMISEPMREVQIRLNRRHCNCVVMLSLHWP